MSCLCRAAVKDFDGTNHDPRCPERTLLPLRAVYERIPETATPAQVREIFDSSAVCLEGFEGAWLHDGGGCDCEKRPGYESTIRQIANAYTKVLAEKRSASLYDRVEAWQKDFLKKHFTGSHGSTSYYGDAASGLAIALQEIDRARYERTSSQVWNEAQSLAPSENLQSEDAAQRFADGKCAAPNHGAQAEPRKRRPHHLCPGPNCDERDVSKWVADGVYTPPPAWLPEVNTVELRNRVMPHLRQLLSKIDENNGNVFDSNVRYFMDWVLTELQTHVEALRPTVQAQDDSARLRALLDKIAKEASSYETLASHGNATALYIAQTLRGIECDT